MKLILLLITLSLSLNALAEESSPESFSCQSCLGSSKFNFNENLIAQADPDLAKIDEAQAEAAEDDPKEEPEDLLTEEVKPPAFPPVREKFSDKEVYVNFGSVYVAQWTYYLIGQHDIIRKTGSAENWRENPFKPHFDKDSFDYNLFKHAVTGNYYYLWYRSRGYTLDEAFMMSFLSSLAFEFTIETITEQPSYQDIYQTPVFGTVMGIGFERASRYFHSLDNWYGHALGYLFNPFTLIPTMRESEVAITPIIDKKEQGFHISLRF